MALLTAVPSQALEVDKAATLETRRNISPTSRSLCVLAAPRSRSPSFKESGELREQMAREDPQPGGTIIKGRMERGHTP